MSTTTTSTTKVTKVMVFSAIAEALAEVTIDGEIVSVSDFCKHEIELIQNKASKAKSKKSVDNSENVQIITDYLTRVGSATPTEIMNECNFPNTQKVSAVLRTMDNVIKTTKGKKVTYSLA